ncbi:structural protein [Vibrio cincinnatiensis]
MRVYIVLFIIFVLYLVTRWSAQTGVIEMTEEAKKLVGPRGYRNNNPLNIRVGNDWQGESLDKTDGEFEQFISPEYGFRAGAKVLKNYQRLYNLKTVRQIIGRWAPSNENDTSNYVNFVARELGVSPDAQINVLSDGSTLARLMLAMSVMECGRGWFTVEQSVEGVALT